MDTRQITDRFAAALPRWWRHVVLVLAAFGVYLLMLGAMQRQLLYYPQHATDAQLLASASRLGLAPWHDATGIRIGWRRTRGVDAPARLVVFHGNAGHALHRGYFADGFSDWNTYLFEYPGYGARAGEPSEDAFKQAALGALDELIAAGSGPLILLGESLGAGVACHLAAERGAAVTGLVLVTPFTRLRDVAAHHFPWVPVSWLLSERWDCARDLSRYAGPVAFLLAGRDDIVPTVLGQRLHDGYPGPKLLRIDSDAGHNSIEYDSRAAWWSEFASFLLAGAHTP